MIDCQDCVRAEANPFTARFTASCKECSARSLAQSPAYFDSARAEAMTATYKAALRYVFGSEWQEGHARVRKWSERLT